MDNREQKRKIQIDIDRLGYNKNIDDIIDRVIDYFKLLTDEDKKITYKITLK